MSETLPSSYRLGYRGDIEGLRAVAILLVVAVHAKVPWLAGGYVGVDVFFVLSGYLITGLLVEEIRRTGDVRFAGFYARRLRRLLPALFLMLICVSLLGWLLLPEMSQFRQADAAGNAALWLGNFFFALSNTGYFGPSAQHNLFLHTWSLGVEEQFYLLWPLLILVVSGAWRGAKRPPRPARLKAVMPIVFAASLVLCLVWSYRSPALGFYMMPSRAWQFALGALVYMYFGVRGSSRGGTAPAPARSKALFVSAGWAGLAMILAAAVVLNRRVVYPGYWALLPSFGAALIIVAGTRVSRLGVGALLSLKPMQATGRVSYAWYLWHWPILVLGANVLATRSAGARIGLVALSLAIAIASYRLVEKPLRRNRLLVVHPRVSVAAGVAIMALAFSAAGVWHSEVATYLSSPVYERFAAARWDAPRIYNLGCDAWYRNARVELCQFGPDDAKHTVVAIGDSISMEWLPAIIKIFNARGWRVVAITKSACPMVDAPLFYARIGREYTVCTKWRARALEKVKRMRPAALIFSTAYSYPFSKRQWIDGTRKVLAEISTSVKQIYLIRGAPDLPFNGPQCLVPRSALYKWIEGRKRCVSSVDDPHFYRVYGWLKTAAKPFDNVRMIDMTGFVCPHGQCSAELDGKIVFRDDKHITASFARYLAPDLANRIFSDPAPAH